MISQCSARQWKLRPPLCTGYALPRIIGNLYTRDKGIHPSTGSGQVWFGSHLPWGESFLSSSLLTLPLSGRSFPESSSVANRGHPGDSPVAFRPRSRTRARFFGTITVFPGLSALTSDPSPRYTFLDDVQRRSKEVNVYACRCDLSQRPGDHPRRPSEADRPQAGQEGPGDLDRRELSHGATCPRRSHRGCLWLSEGRRFAHQGPAQGA